jgi:hypothetical protein
MDYFENIIQKILENDGKWVKQNVKVNLTKEEKRAAGKPSMPRPDIDILTYKPSTNTIELWEVKSYLDSPGVKFKDLQMKPGIQAGRYKILTSEKYQKIIIKRLTEDLVKEGLIRKNPKVKMALAIGHIGHSKDESDIRNYFNKKGWELFTPSDIKARLSKLASIPYENNPYTLTAKIFLK